MFQLGMKTGQDVREKRKTVLCLVDLNDGSAMVRWELLIF